MSIERFEGRYRFLSNFYPCLVAFDGDDYQSVEHAYQAAKTTSKEERRLIASMPTAGNAKRAGKRVTIREDWDEIKVSVMTRLLRSKFSNDNEELMANLLDTGDEELIEGNYWGDKFWGVFNGEGRNELGKALMLIRGELRQPKKVRRAFNKVGNPQLPESPTLPEIAQWLRDKAHWQQLQESGREMDAREWAATCLNSAAEDLDVVVASSE